MRLQVNEIVPKGWGSEHIWVSNDKYCGKLLKFEEGKEFSMHFHANKHETWFVVDGEFSLQWIDTNNAKVHTEVLVAGDIWENPPLFPHKLVCVKPGTIIEVSTKDTKEDNYRVMPGSSQK